eukprot:682098-Hanusia_phi.AAC.1
MCIRDSPCPCPCSAHPLQVAKSLGKHLAESNRKSRLVVGKCILPLLLPSPSSSLPPLTLAVCGRNQKLRLRLERHTWPSGCELEKLSEEKEKPRDAGGEEASGDLQEEEGQEKRGEEGARVKVRVVGFLDNVEEYMLASDVIVSKAGP